MNKTIEAIYENGKIIPINEEIKIKKSKVLITFINAKEDSVNKKRISEKDLKDFSNSITLKEDPLEYQRRLRNEW